MLQRLSFIQLYDAIKPSLRIVATLIYELQRTTGIENQTIQGYLKRLGPIEWQKFINEERINTPEGFIG
jgi:hypothetical protein